MFSRYFHILLCAIAACFYLKPSLAQTPEQKSTQHLDSLEEIIVTMARREQQLQDVPLSITALTGTSREQMGITDIQDMSDFTPGFTYNMYTDAQRMPMFVDRTEILRGPQGALSGRNSIAGAIYTHLKRPSDTFELEARTFVKNYQGYGGGLTVSGPITESMRVRVNLSGTGQDKGFFHNMANGNWEGNQPYQRQLADYMLEVDLTNQLQWYLKASFINYDESRRTGSRRAPYVADVLGDSPSAYGSLGSPLVPLAAWGYFDPDGEHMGPNLNPSIDNYRQFTSDFNSYQKLDDHHNYMSQLNWDAGDVQLKWVAGHQAYYYEHQQDADGTAVISMRLPATLVYPLGRVVSPAAINQFDEQREWFSNELTLSSNTDGALSWLAGLYHFNETYKQHPQNTYHPGYDELANPLNPFGISANPYFAIPNRSGNASVFGEVQGETDSYAIYGQTEYQINEPWALTLGLRYNRDKKDAVEENRYVANNVGLGHYLAGSGIAMDVTPGMPRDPLGNLLPLPAGVVNDYWDASSGHRAREMQGHWSAITGTFGINFKPGNHSLYYVRLASGYRPGGFDAPYLPSDPLVNEESLISYEIGYKGTIAERLTLNVSSFLYDYQDQQLLLPALGICANPDDLGTCTISTNYENIPDTQSLGLELEANWYATDNLGFYLSYGYLDTEIKDGGKGYQNPLDPSALQVNARRMTEITGQTDNGYTGLSRWLQDITGKRLANSPEHKVAFNTRYSMDFQAGSLMLSANYVWRDESEYDIFNTPAAIADGYSTLSTRAIWTNAGDTFSVILFGTNLGNEIARDRGGAERLATTASGPQGQAYYEAYNLAPPRTYGLELQYRLY